MGKGFSIWPMASLAEIPKSSLVQRVKNMTAKSREIRETAERKTKQVIGAGLAGGAGYGLGYLNQKKPEAMTIAGTDLPTDGVAGAVAIAIGITDMAGSQSELIMDIGKGCLAVYGYRKGYEG